MNVAQTGLGDFKNHHMQIRLDVNRVVLQVNSSNGGNGSVITFHQKHAHASESCRVEMTQRLRRHFNLLNIKIVKIFLSMAIHLVCT